ncbi:MAG TPA: hypothetical protein VMU47_04525 [Caldimonas sp.]|nr:hypothetical protein [Caldimonas sp.]
MTRAARPSALQRAATAAAALAVRSVVALLLVAFSGPRRGSLAPGLLGHVVTVALALAFAS